MNRRSLITGAAALSAYAGLARAGLSHRSGGGGGGYTTGAVALDGATNLINAALASTDNGFLSFSLWTNAQDATPSDDNIVWIVDPTGIYGSNFQWSVGGNFVFNATNSDATAVVDCEPVGSPTVGSWTNYIGAVQSNLGAGSKIIKLFQNGIDITATINDSEASFVAAFNGLPLYIGTDTFADNFTGYLADLWIAPGQSLLTGSTISAGTLAKFISGGKPVNLGSDGSTPTGTAPAVFLHIPHGGTPANFANNLGTGGNFSITGSLTLAPSSPSD